MSDLPYARSMTCLYKLTKLTGHARLNVLFGFSVLLYSPFIK